MSGESKMNVGFVGLGKLGLPVSVAMCNHTTHSFYCYDSDKGKLGEYARGEVSLYEPDIKGQLAEALSSGRYNLCLSLDSVLEHHPDIIFVAVPTPTTGLSERFNLNGVKNVVRELCDKADHKVTVAVISTVLPGDTRKTVLPPLLRVTHPRYVTLCYNPSFIAMGTTCEDLLNPEFVLIGNDEDECPTLEAFYEDLYCSKPNLPILQMSWEEAEIVKMAYNTMIGFKIVYANALMELADKIGHANVDVISNALGKATRRITSSSYLRGGMGDGGGCHPRDNMALSHIAEEFNLSANPFRFVMDARDKQARWIAKILLDYNMPVVLMGKRYKPNTNLTDYSATLLVEAHLRLLSPETEVCIYDPLLGLNPDTDGSRVYLIGHDYDFVHTHSYGSGSVVVDPWRCFSDAEIVKLDEVIVTYYPIGVS